MAGLGFGELIVLLLILGFCAVFYGAPIACAVVLFRSARRYEGRAGRSVPVVAALGGVVTLASCCAPTLAISAMRNVADADGSTKAVALAQAIQTTMRVGGVLYLIGWLLLAIAGVLVFLASRRRDAE
jgi:hypothetical protein